MNNKLNPFKHLKNDIPASIIVFLVALPLCLGIAQVSGAPALAGLISGIVGGIIVGSLSGSSLGVSGPAAGLAVIVLAAINSFGGLENGGFEIFLVAVVLSGIIQVIMGFAKAGIIGYYFPSSVIHGMLSGIGIYIFMKQIPVIFGITGGIDYSQLATSVNPQIMLIAAVSLSILILWETKFIKKFKVTQLIQGPLIAVIAGIVIVSVLTSSFGLIIDKEFAANYMVVIPEINSVKDFIVYPDFNALTNPKVYSTALVIAVVASIETLLCTDASDKMDPLKRLTPTNRELKAQGVGNIISGLIGGLPITQVIVRSSVNMQSGGKTKAAAVIHGFLILISVISIPFVLNLIPKATLAAILMLVGYKLAKPALFKKMYKDGWDQFVPFVVTALGIVLTDLLVGIGLGMAVAIFIILYNNYKVTYQLNEEKENGKKKYSLEFSENITFLNKAAIQKTLTEVPENSIVEIDGSKTHFIHQDVLEIIDDFKQNAKSRNILVRKNNLVKFNKEEFEKYYQKN